MGGMVCLAGRDPLHSHVMGRRARSGSRLFRWALALAGWLVLGAATALVAQSEDPMAALAEDPMTPPSLIADWPLWRWQTLAGDDALQAGLPGVAEGLYRRVLESGDLLDTETRALVRVKLASALIAQRRFAAAGEVLPEPEGGVGPAVRLRRAILAYLRGELGATRRWLALVQPANLGQADQPWYFLLLGMEARARGDQSVSGPALEQALARAVSPAQRAQIEAVILKGVVVAGEDDERTLRLLQTKAEETRGTRAGFDFARQLAVVLDRMGRQDEAITVLRDQLKMLTEPETVEAGQLLLLTGLVAGQDSPRGQLAFREILEGKGDVGAQRLALYLLAANAVTAEDGARAGFRETLDELIARGGHPLADELLLLRGRLKLEAGDLPGADADIGELVEEFPASPLLSDALWLRAYIAWEEGRYRSAADHLQRIRENLDAGAQRVRVGELIGDCYFLNTDYPAAADFYAAVLAESQDGSDADTLFFQAVLANSLARRWDQARALLDAPADYDEATRWRAEWSLLDALRRAGEAERARQRLLALLTRDLPLDDQLRWRLEWLNARLAYETGEAAIAARRAGALATEVETGVDEDPGRAEIASRVRLLEAQAFIRAGEPEQGLAALARLRETYPGSDPAILSILEEARYFAGEFSLAEAQRRLRELADRYPDSPHAPAALYEAAILADRQGLESTRRESLAILRDLIERYPGNSLVFYARLMQGNIARQLGEFGDARAVYETLLRDFPAHPEIYLAELYRANTLLARSAEDPVLLGEAAAGLERLIDLSSVPVDVRVEAGYTLSRVQLMQGNRRLAAQTLWLVVSRFLRDPSAAVRLGANGQHWMARCLLELGDILEQEGEIEDAREIYAQFSAYGLPGGKLAAARLEKLQSGR